MNTKNNKNYEERVAAFYTFHDKINYIKQTTVLIKVRIVRTLELDFIIF